MIKIAMLTWPVSRLDSKCFGGLEVVEFFHLKELKKYSEVVIYGKTKTETNNIKNLERIPILGTYDFLYYYDFVMKNQEKEIIIGYNTPLLALFSNKKTIIYFQNLLKLFGRFQVCFLPFYFLFKKRYSKMKYIFASDFLKTEFIKRYPEIPRENLYILPNFVDTAFVSKIHRRYEQNNKKKIVFAGQWNKLKGFDLLIKSVTKLRKERTDFIIYLIGGYDLWGKKENQIYIPKKNFIKKIGKLSHENTLRFFNKMDIMVIPSVWEEAFGIVAIEGMAYKLITIASNRGGLNQLIDTKCGIKFVPDNEDNLVEALNSALNLSVKQQKKIIKNAQKKIKQKYLPKIHINQLLQIITRIKNERV